MKRVKVDRPVHGRNGKAADESGPATRSAAIRPYYQDDAVTIYNADSTKLSFVADGSVQLLIRA